MKKLFFGVVFALTVAFLGGCGDDSRENQFTARPGSASEAKSAYDLAPQMLESYFYEMDTSGKSSNPDTVATSSELGTRLSISYKGVEIYSETHGWGIYMGHGFTKSGIYMILLEEYDAGYHVGTRKIFIDGVLASIKTQYPINDIRDIGDGWLVLVSQVGTPRAGLIVFHISIYNMNTKELIEFGEYPGQRP